MKDLYPGNKLVSAIVIWIWPGSTRFLKFWFMSGLDYGGQEESLNIIVDTMLPNVNPDIAIESSVLINESNAATTTTTIGCLIVHYEFTILFTYFCTASVP